MPSARKNRRQKMQHVSANRKRMRKNKKKEKSANITWYVNIFFYEMFDFVCYPFMKQKDKVLHQTQVLIYSSVTLVNRV